MKKTTVRCHLMDILAEVPDPRIGKRKTSSARSGILALGVVATLSGAQELRSDRRIRTVLMQLLRVPLDLQHSKTPCAKQSFYNVFTRLRCRCFDCKTDALGDPGFREFSSLSVSRELP